MSGLIAHNRDDLEELKRRGDRNYYEFTLPKAKSPQRVGPVQMTLNKADQKKSKYTIMVLPTIAPSRRKTKPPASRCSFT